MENKELFRQSEAVVNLINTEPSFIIRKGISILFSFLVLVLLVSCFVRYPDIVVANARIITINGPKAVLSKQSGRIVKLIQQEGQNVKQNDELFYVESLADHKTVLRLEKILDSILALINQGEFERISQLWTLSEQNIVKYGELQQMHQLFMTAYYSLRDNLPGGRVMSKREFLYNDIEYKKKLLNYISVQKKIQAEDLALATTTYKMHDTLYAQKVISGLDLRNQRSQLLNKELVLPQSDIALLNLQIQMGVTSEELKELTIQIENEKRLFIQALNIYRSQIQEWKQKFVITAPIAGTLSYFSFFEENQQVADGQVVAFISSFSKDYVLEMTIPQFNFGKVAVGQTVLLKFPSFPVQEFGVVKGKIASIKDIPADSGYLAKVVLDGSFLKAHHKSISFTEGLTARAEIITRPKRLIQRIIGTIEELF